MQKGTDLILVTGATGNQGNAVARQLLANGHKVRAMTRRPEGPAAQALGSLGAEVVQGDFDDSASLERALDGAWGVFAVQNTWEAGVEKEEEHGKRLAELARKMGGHTSFTRQSDRPIARLAFPISTTSGGSRRRYAVSEFRHTPSFVPCSSWKTGLRPGSSPAWTRAS